MGPDPNRVPDRPQARREPGRLNTGITVVGKRAVIPRGVRIGRNVLIGEGVRATDFQSRVIRSGSTVERPRERIVRATVRAVVGGSPVGHGAPADASDAANASDASNAADVSVGAAPASDPGGRTGGEGRHAAGAKD